MLEDKNIEMMLSQIPKQKSYYKSAEILFGKRNSSSS